MHFIKTVILPIIVVLLLTLGQSGFKFVGNKLATDMSLNGLWSAKFEFIATLSVYAIATFLWVYILSYMPLSRAFTYYALVFVIVPLIATFVFHEDVINPQFLLGSALIIIGVVIAGRASL